MQNLILLDAAFFVSTALECVRASLKYGPESFPWEIHIAVSPLKLNFSFIMIHGYTAFQNTIYRYNQSLTTAIHLCVLNNMFVSRFVNNPDIRYGKNHICFTPTVFTDEN